MVDFISGLLGGVAGTGEAVAEIGDDKLKELADHLKMKAMAEINQETDERRFGYDKQLQTENQLFEADQNKQQREFQKGLSEAEIGSTEKMAGERNALTARLANMEAGLKEQQIKADKDDAYARNLQAQIKAIEESRKITEMGGSIDEINAPLEAAGLPVMEEYEMVPGKEGLFSDTPPIMGMRRKGAGAPPEPPANAPKVGTVDGGYKFKGGNPADPKNWEKI